MNDRRKGLSLVEVVVASAILVILVVVVFSLLTTSSSHYESQSVLLALDERGREVLNEISKDLRMSKMEMLVDGATGTAVVPDNAKTYTSLQFRLPGPLPAGTKALEEYKQNPDRLFTRRVRFAWAADPADPVDALDNNKNGLVNEGLVEKVEEDLKPDGTPLATRRSRICSDVKQNGLVFKVPATGSGRVEITLDLEKADPKNRSKKVTRTVQTTVELRN